MSDPEGRRRAAPEEAPLSAAQRDGVARSTLPLRLAASMKRRGNVLPFDELVSIGNLQLARTASRYDPAQNDSLDAYAFPAVRFTMIKAAQGMIRAHERRFLDAAVLAGCDYLAQPSAEDGSADSDEEALGRLRSVRDGLVASVLTSYLCHRSRSDTERAAAETIDRQRALAILDEEIAALPRYRELIRLRNFEGREWPDVAQALGVAPATACRQHAAAMRLLGARLRARGVADLLQG